MSNTYRKNIDCDKVDKQSIANSVTFLDMFAKTYCYYQYDWYSPIELRCDECPFREEDGHCLVKAFKDKYAPKYQGFGLVGHGVYKSKRK